MTDLERLIAIEAIRQMKARYFRCIDTKDWNGFIDCFTADAVVDVSVPGRLVETESGIYRGVDAIAKWAPVAVGNAVTVHQLLMPEIEILSSTSARGTWALEDRFVWPEGSPRRTMHGCGHEHETYERVGGEWKIRSSKLTRLRLDIT
jgi:hypothetical protein